MQTAWYEAFAPERAKSEGEATLATRAAPEGGKNGKTAYAWELKSKKRVDCVAKDVVMRSLVLSAHAVGTILKNSKPIAPSEQVTTEECMTSTTVE